MEMKIEGMNPDKDSMEGQPIPEDPFEWENLDLSYYEQTEAVHRFHMNKI